MKIVLFYHSLISDWNHGNAHFLRGTVKALQKIGEEVVVMEPKNNWSLTNLLQENEQAFADFEQHYPGLTSTLYDETNPEIDEIIKDADLVIAHEWNNSSIISLLGDKKYEYNYKLLFHDTHHRAVSAEEEMDRYNLTHYDGVLAFGQALKEIYLIKGWAQKVWVWHEAADTTLFHPVDGVQKQGDLVWVGNWGDNERASELEEFLINPVKELGIKAKIYGVRYPDEALEKLKDAGISYGGYLPSHQVPQVFAAYQLTVHVPRSFYTHALPGIPTIRPFEAMACGIPLISAPWNDSENLFRPNEDYLQVNNGEEMKAAIQEVLNDDIRRKSLAASGLQTVLSRHTCEHRAKELIRIYDQLNR